MAVQSQLRKRHRHVPKQVLLQSLFEVLYYASMRTEEADHVAVHIVYLDPNNHDPDPPQRIVKDRWSFVRLEKEIAFTDVSLIKIAKATDPRTSSLVVYPNKDNRLMIWGLVDQQNRYHDYLVHDSDSGAERPGIFEVSVSGIGRLAVSIGYEKIAELIISEVISASINVLRKGIIFKHLSPGITRHLQNVDKIPKQILEGRPHWESTIIHNWLDTLSRLLLRIQGFRSGGAFIIKPNSEAEGLNIKYSLNYQRLHHALSQRAILLVEKTHASDQIDDLLEKDTDEISTELYLDETVSSNDLEETESELDSAIWFVALLTRVDGAVILTQDLDVDGFGAEITYDQIPGDVYRCHNPNPKLNQMEQIDYNQYGTRHRSMMRFCAKVPGSVGFVVSQDGDVKVITSVGHKVLVWDNISLRKHESDHIIRL